jgi:hypothetical protein
MTKKDIINRLLIISDDANNNKKEALKNGLPFSHFHEQAKKETVKLLEGFEYYKNLDDYQETYASDEARPQSRNSCGNVIKYIKHGRQFFQVYDVGISKHYGRGEFVKL